MGTCPNNSWMNCPNAYRAQEKGWPVMLCKLTGKHPDECANASRLRPELTADCGNQYTGGQDF